MLSHFLSSVRNLWPSLTDPLNFQHRPKLALVLSGGGARGLAHIGVLEELEKAGIVVDLIVGCSSGSLVGALYADHQSAIAVKNILFNLKKKDLVNYNFLNSRYGLAKGEALRKVLQNNLSCLEFEKLKIPFISVATDLQTGELVILKEGLIVPAVHASCAVPFYFEPVMLDDRILIDGGVVDSVPTSVAKSLNPHLIVAVDLNQSLKKSLPTHLFGVAKRSWEILLFHQSKRCLKHADIIIKPELQNIGIFDESNNHTIYKAGQEAALREIPQILESIKGP